MRAEELLLSPDQCLMRPGWSGGWAGGGLEPAVRLVMSSGRAGVFIRKYCCVRLLKYSGLAFQSSEGFDWRFIVLSSEFVFDHRADFPGNCVGSEISANGTDCYFTNSPDNNLVKMTVSTLSSSALNETESDYSHMNSSSLWSQCQHVFLPSPTIGELEANFKIIREVKQHKKDMCNNVIL